MSWKERLGLPEEFPLFLVIGLFLTVLIVNLSLLAIGVWVVAQVLKLTGVIL
jgi:hypothetical protein